MFNLDLAISEWRRQMAAGGVSTPAALDELEGHLRDDVEQQTRSGVNARQAFEAAVRRIGRPGLLKSEFDKISGMVKAPERVKHALLTLAGIPNHYLGKRMETSDPNIEARWATYLRAAAFLAPAAVLWATAVELVLPKLQQICYHEAGLTGPALVWDLTRYNGALMYLVKDHSILISFVIILMLVFLERWSCTWPRYRRAAIGFAVFLVNSVALGSIFMMIVSATFAASVLFHPAK